MADPALKEPDAVADTPPNDLPVWPMRVMLNRPIKVIDEDGDREQNEIVFREPTAADIASVGNPVIILDWEKGTLAYDAARMAKMMSRLSGIADVFLGKMNTIDWNTCAVSLQRFFLPDVDRVA